MAAIVAPPNALPLRPFSEDEFINLGLQMRGKCHGTRVEELEAQLSD
jgi:hypothetical protein